jgi:lysophospholipase L1-like esterase
MTTIVNPSLGAVSLNTGSTYVQSSSPTWSYICALGDSLSNATYDAALQTLLGSAYTVVEKGIGSDTVVQMLARLDADVTSTPADCVIVWGGVNDVAGGADATTIEGNLQSIYDACHTDGLLVVAITNTPYKGSATWTAEKQVIFEAVNTWIGATATNVDYVVDMYALLEDPAEPDTLLAAYDSGDHIHLSAAGYSLVASTLFGQVPF